MSLSTSVKRCKNILFDERLLSLDRQPFVVHRILKREQNRRSVSKKNSTVTQQTLVGKKVGGAKILVYLGDRKKIGGFLPHQPLLDDCNSDR